MPNIYDNSEDRILLTRLEQNLTASSHADVCVGYFNLHGYTDIAEEIQHFTGGEGSQLRVIVGMSNSPHVDARRAARSIDTTNAPTNELITARKKAALELFADQFSFRTPNPSDEQGLLQLRADLAAGKIVVKLYTKHQLHAKLYLTYGKDRTIAYPDIAFIGSSNLTAAGLRGQGELTVDNPDPQNVAFLREWFQTQWEQRSTVDISKDLIELIDNGWVRPATPYEIYLKMVYHMSQDVISGTSYDIPVDIRQDLLDFQLAAVQLAARHVETRGGALLGDVVGLGKSLMATAIVRIFEELYDWRTLILCPKNLESMWKNDYVHKYDLNADVLPLSMVNVLPEYGKSYKLIIVDESHNLRNPENKTFQKVRDFITEKGAKVILLSATPYNISVADIATQLRLFINADDRLPVRPERWLRETSAESVAKKMTSTRPDTLQAFSYSPFPEDWRDLLRLFMVRRTRSFIKQHYAQYDAQRQQHYLTFGNGNRNYFPTRLPKTAHFTVRDGDQYQRLYSSEVVDIIGQLQLPRYGLKGYVAAGATLTDEEQRIVDDLGRAGSRLKGFARSSFFKRLESSGSVFLMSLQRHIMRNAMMLHALHTDQPVPVGQFDAAEFDASVNDEDFLYGGPDEDRSALLAASAADLYRLVQSANVRWLRPTVFSPSLAQTLQDDITDLQSIINMVQIWNPAQDEKLNALERLLTTTHGTQKVLVFTQFADTAHYLVSNLRQRGVRAIADVTGQSEAPHKIADRFSPVARKVTINPADELRVIVATDVLSEGQNLQDAHVVVNYDLPWAVIRLVQRAGRVDRIGQQASEILCYSFLPTDGVESVLKLRQRIAQRLTSSGDIIGGFDQLIEGLVDETAVVDVYTERSKIYEETDNDVDMASYCYQIWQQATMTNRTLEQSIPNLPAQIRSAKAHRAGLGEPHGVLSFIRTKSGLSALTYTNVAGDIVSQSAKRIIDTAACPYDEPRRALAAHHDAHVTATLTAVTEAYRSQEVGIGPSNSARYRTYHRLVSYVQKNVGALRDYELERVVERMLNTPFTERAIDTLNRLLRSRETSDQELAERAMSFHREHKLFIPTVSDDEDFATIVCSLGLVEGNT